MNIASLLESDHKVSDLCKMTDQKLNTLIETDLGTGKQINDHFISQIIAAAIDYNETQFDKIFSNALLRLGLRDTYINVIFPTLNRLGIMWSTQTLRPAHEHFISSLFRQKFLAAIDALPPPKETQPTWLLFLPEDEFHETGLLFANYLIRQSGNKVIYLGSNVPEESLISAQKDKKANKLLFFLVRKNTEENDSKYISSLSKQFKDLEIYVGCNTERLKNIKISKNINILNSVSDLEEIINKN